MRFLAASVTALAIVGCSERPSPADPASEAVETIRLTDDGADLYRDRVCENETPYRAPKVGDEFQYKLIGEDRALIEGVTRKEVIRRVAGDVVDYAESMLMDAGETPGEPRRLRSGLLPISGPGSSLSYPAELRSPFTLRIGEEVVYPVSYTAQGQLGEQTLQTKVSVRFVGCRTIAPGLGAASGEAVRVFRVILPALSPPPAPDGLTATEMEWAISERTGWRVLERSASASTLLVKMRPG